MRVALASVLFAAPDLLLLDEPSNYLDLEGVMWLENFLRSYPHTVILVSHDRDILNSSVDAILHLENRKLTLYSGGYDRFEDTRREQQRLQLKLRKKQDEMRRHMEAFVDRFRAQANKARQAQSRLKALAKMQPIAAAVEESVVPFRFPSPERALANPLIRIENGAVGYDPDTPVLRDLDLRLDADDRIALLGANGNGKSTLAKLLAGRLAPCAGHRRASKKMETGFFAQHQMDDLDPAKSPYDYVAALMEDATEAQKRAKLGQLGFGADKADTKCEKLSGGEKARLLMALAAFGAPHLLILDEPTNHLDVDSREALIRALNEYEGAVILISHDRHLVEACADRLWLVAGGTAEPYDGDIASYRAQVTGPKSSNRAFTRAGAAPDQGRGPPHRRFPPRRTGAAEKDNQAARNPHSGAQGEARQARRSSGRPGALRHRSRQGEAICPQARRVDERAGRGRGGLACRLRGLRESRRGAGYLVGLMVNPSGRNPALLNDLDVFNPGVARAGSGKAPA